MTKTKKSKKVGEAARRRDRGDPRGGQGSCPSSGKNPTWSDKFVGFTHSSYLLSLLYVSPEELEKFCDGRTRLPVLPDDLFYPTPFDVIYGANKETFTGHAKHQQEIPITFMH